MKRTKNAPPSLIPMVRRKEAPSLDKVESDIEDYMMPKLKQYGFGSRVINGTVLNERQKPKEFEQYSKMNPRWLLSKTDIYLEIWPKSTPNYKLVVRPFVVESTDTKSLGNRPRFNLNRRIMEYLDTIPEGIRHKMICSGLFMLDMHFLIMTKTGQFWLGKFSSIKDQFYYLTYRKDPNRLDRLATKAEIQVGQFHSVKSMLANELQSYMYYFNKNNNYGNQ